jgi:hypothetical protein
MARNAVRWVAAGLAVTAILGFAACNYTEGQCYRREDIEGPGSDGVGGGPIVPGWGGDRFATGVLEMLSYGRHTAPNSSTGNDLRRRGCNHDRRHRERCVVHLDAHEARAAAGDLLLETGLYYEGSVQGEVPGPWGDGDTMKHSAGLETG